MIENRQLKYFVVAARYMNITRAAEALHLSQPALTRNIHQLEDQLRVSLFRRAGRRITLTEAGECLLAEAQSMLLQLDRSIIATQKASRGELGKLVIGCTSAAGLVGVPMLVKRFRERHPGPMIILQEFDSAHDRHVEIEQNQAGFFGVRVAQVGQRLLAVFPEHQGVGDMQILQRTLHSHGVHFVVLHQPDGLIGESHD